MIIYTVDLFDKETEELISEIDIPEKDLPSIATIMKWNEEDKMDFIKGIAVFNVKKLQAEPIGKLLNQLIDTDKCIIQMSAGEI